MEFSASPFPDPLPKEPTPRPSRLPAGQEGSEQGATANPELVYTSSSFPAPEFPAWPAPTSSAQEKPAPASWPSVTAEEPQPEIPGQYAENEELAEAEDLPRGFWQKIAGSLVLVFLIALGLWFIFAPQKESPPLAPIDVPPTPSTDSAYVQGKPKNPHLVFAETGGQIAYSDGASLIIPARALVVDTEIFIEKTAEGEVTDLYEIKPHGLKFLKPATLEVPYKSSEPKKIILEWWSSGENPQRKILPFTVDWKNKKLRAQVGEL